MSAVPFHGRLPHHRRLRAPGSGLGPAMPVPGPEHPVLPRGNPAMAPLPARWGLQHPAYPRSGKHPRGALVGLAWPWRPSWPRTPSPRTAEAADMRIGRVGAVPPHPRTPGTYECYCRCHVHPGMTGTIVVEA